MAQDGQPRRISVVFPIILITVGGLFLWHNWHPTFDPLPVLWTYWPLILIFIGIGKIWDSVYRSRNPNAPSGISIGATVGALAFVVVLVVLLWHGRNVSGRHSFGSFNSRHVTRIVEPQRAKSAQARLDMGAGQLNINGGAKDFLDADFTFSDSFEEPRVEYSVSDSVGQLYISQQSHSHLGRSQNDWSLHFSKDIPLELKIDMGAGQGDLHFRDIPLTRLNLNMGAGQVDVDLTGERKTDLTADIEGGVGQATIRLPKSVCVIAHASGGIGSIDVHGLRHDGDSYTNDACGKTPPTIHLKIEGGIGQINLNVEP